MSSIYIGDAGKDLWAKAFAVSKIRLAMRQQEMYGADALHPEDITQARMRIQEKLVEQAGCTFFGEAVPTIRSRIRTAAKLDLLECERHYDIA